MTNELDPYKRMTPLLTQDLKTLGLWVLFLICWVETLLNTNNSFTNDSHLYRCQTVHIWVGVGSDITCWENLREKQRGDQTKVRNESDSHKEMTPPSI